jgi:predicted TIM-barrel fold metal-dependent hydrolase
MPGELIIDVHAHVYRTPEIGRQAMEHAGRPLPWGGIIDELRALMHELGIGRTVIATATPTQTMREKALAQLPATLSESEREKAEVDVHTRMLERLNHNNLWGCEVGRLHPEFLPFVNLDPVLMDAVTIRQTIRQAVAHGARGILLLPALHGFYGNDRRAWPIYEMAQSFQLPILAQTGDAGPIPPTGRGHWGRPRYFGDVAVSFPKLTLILGHLGKGYESEIAVLTRRYANVYTETSMRLSGLGEPGKWTPAEAVTWFRLIGIDRIFFGTKWPLFDPRRDLDAIRTLPLTPAERAKILGENARRVLQI